MTVAMTASKTLSGSAVADSLTGGASGYDWGESETGDADPPQYAIYLYHDGSNEVTNLSVNAQAMSGTYGGDYSANADLTKLLAHGDAGSGLELCMVWNESTLFTTSEIIATGNGDNFPNKIPLPVGAFSYDNASTETDASSPVEGQLGESGNTSLGDHAHITGRYVTPSGETAVGRRQFDLYFSYNFTS